MSMADIPKANGLNSKVGAEEGRGGVVWWVQGAAMIVPPSLHQGGWMASV